MNSHLDHKYASLLESILAGSLPRSLRWSDVIELIGKVGRVEPHGGTEFAFVVGSQRAFFKSPSAHILDVSDISRLRRFLRDAGQGEVGHKPIQSGRMVVVLDHHLARVYQNLDGSRPQDEDAIRPYDPHGFHRHLIHRKEAHYQGERVPEEHSFYEEIACDLAHSQEIVLIGHGTGKSNAVDFLAEYLKKHHGTIYERVIATENADLSSLTEPEIETIARKHM